MLSMEDKYMDLPLHITKELYNIIKTYIYEMELEDTMDVEDFIVSAIVEKFNNENTIFSGEIDEYGFTDGRSATEHFME